MLIILKRFEIWILFALVIAAFWWAMQADISINPEGVSGNHSQQLGASDSDTNGDETEGNNALVEVTQVNLLNSDSGIVLELTLLGQSGTESSDTLTEDSLEVLTSEGDKIHRFYLPFDTSPEFLASEKSKVTLKYWLAKPIDVVWLTYRDQTVKVDLPFPEKA